MKSCVLEMIGVAFGAWDTCQRAVSFQIEIVRRSAEGGSQIAFVSTAGMPEFLPPYILGVSVLAVILAVSFAIGQRGRPLRPG